MAEMISLNELNALPYNPRVITAQELDDLKASIVEHTKAIPRKERAKGYRLVSTITVNRKGNRIVGGHQRIKALQELGQEFLDKRDITWIELIPDSPEEKALNIALNDPHRQGQYDESQLNEILNDIKTDNDELFGRLNFGLFQPDTTPVEPTQSFTSDSKSPESRGNTNEPLLINDSSENSEKTNLIEDSAEGLDFEDMEDVSKNPQLFPFSCALTIEQRNIILQAIKDAKKDIETQESSEALAHICQEYIKSESKEE